MYKVVVLVVVAACTSGSNDAPKQGSAAVPPAVRDAMPASAPPLPAGPVPVALPALDPSQLRTLARATHGYLTVDATGVVRWGLDVTGAKPFEGQLLERDDSALGQLFPYADARGHEHHAFRAASVVEPDVDWYAELTHDPVTEIVILADAAAPARITLRRAVQGLGRHASTLAAGAANTATLFKLGVDSWRPTTQPELTLHVDNLAALAGQHPTGALVEITDTTTTGQLVAALGALGAAGVKHLRIHRMMGWGDIGPSDKISLEGASAEDDRFVGSPATVDIADATVEGALDEPGVTSALRAFKTRFRYCFEMRDKPKLHGDVKLAFDVAADGAISNAKATGLDPKIDSCIAGAIFDLDITPLSVHGAGHASTQITFTPDPANEPAKQVH